MARREENIYRRKDDRWEARYIKGRALPRTVRYRACRGKTYRSAQANHARCRAVVHLGAAAPDLPGRRRFADFCEAWLRLAKGRVKQSTYDKYEAVLKNHILPKLGGRFPLGITTPVAENFRDGLLREGLSAKTVRDILTMLRSILKYTGRQFPGGFPNVEVSMPKEVKKEARVLDPDEQKRLIDFLQTDMDTYKFGVLFALLTGIRVGELCALRWANVSLKNRTVRVEMTLHRVRDAEHTDGRKTKMVFDTPKSETSARTIPLTEHAVRLCERFDPHAPNAFLLTGTERFMEPRQIQRRMKKYTDACGLEGVHFHTIRHTFATRCVEAGFEVKSLSEILGHADTSITLNRYVHSSLQLKRENMEKLSAVGL